MPSFSCCFGNWRSSIGSNAGTQSIEEPSASNPAAQNVEQPTTSEPAVQNAEQPSTSDPDEPNADEQTTSDAGVRDVDQPSTSYAGAQKVDEPSTSNPSDARPVVPSKPVIRGNLTYDQVAQVLFRLAEFKPPSQYREEGEVCHGTLNNKRVAIKGLQNQGSESEEFDEILSSLKEADHPNLIKVIGHLIRWEGRFVVYDCFNLASLDHHLFDPETEPLDCETRMKIAIGTAKGLEYLHSMNPPAVHRNLKAENVLLDEGFVPKLFDFGVPRKAHEWWNTSRPFNIVGWVAPEYIETGQLTLETDVYSFGVLLLVILTGRRAFDERRPHDRSVSAWARSVWDHDMKDKDLKDIKEEVIDGIVDPRMREKCGKEIVYPIFKLALSCIDLNPSSRPKMTTVCTQLVIFASLMCSHTAETKRRLSA